MNPVAADKIVTSFIGSYMSENGTTPHNIYMCQMGTQFRPGTVVSAWLSVSVRLYNAFSALPPNAVTARDPLTLPPPPEFDLLSLDGLVFISKITRRLVDYRYNI